VTDQASAIGVSAVPLPVANDSSDWFVYARLAGTFEFGSAIGFAQKGEVMVIDSRAMRKVDLGEDLITVVQAGPAPSLGSRVTTYLKMLVKLH